MSLSPKRLACSLLLCLSPFVCHADSAASSASSAGSASIGSLSRSIQGSSDSSSRDKVAEGDYRIIEVADAPEADGMLQLTLQAAAPRADTFQLTLPQQLFAQRGLAAGDVVSARHRPYGIEFALATTQEPFFLVLTDDWHHELDPRAVTL